MFLLYIGLATDIYILVFAFELSFRFSMSPIVVVDSTLCLIKHDFWILLIDL